MGLLDKIREKIERERMVKHTAFAEERKAKTDLPREEKKAYWKAYISERKKLARKKAREDAKKEATPSLFGRFGEGYMKARKMYWDFQKSGKEMGIPSLTEWNLGKNSKKRRKNAWW